MDYFATFGSSQLSNYDINPMKVMLLLPAGLTEEEFRAVLKIRFDNKYCTVYPSIEMRGLMKEYNMRMLTMAQLELHKLDITGKED